MLDRAATEISLGLFAWDMTNLASCAARAVSWGASVLHFDVMDGIFVPQFTAGAGVMKGLGVHGLLDVHLMVARPLDHVADFVASGANLLTVHAEAEDPDKAFAHARETAAGLGQDLRAGIALMPGTPLDKVGGLFAMKPDIVLVLALDPRDGKPADIAYALSRVAEIRARAP